MPRISSPAELEKARREITAKRDLSKPCITLCSGTGCHAYASDKVALAFEEEVKKAGLATKVDFRRTGCHGFCERGPLVVIYPEETCYVQVQPSDVPEIISQTMIDQEVIDRLLYADPSTGEKTVRESKIPFYEHQTRLILGSNSKIDPKSIEDYLALGGYSALAKALHQMTPQQIIQETKRANVRGRGGGGFPTGRKWEICRNAPGEIKYVIVNCDEGDPGAYMDRSLMEGNPHSVLEGMIIGAYAIGSHEGYVYVRNEYPLAVENLRIAIGQAEEYGFLGEDILGSGFDFNVKVHRGGGSFVCGEETGLISSLEGRTADPRPRPPYPAVSGLWGRPTNINNVETWANIPLIINNGADWYTSIGTQGSKGTKIFSLVGKVNNTGLIEVPMGIALREIVHDIGGGPRDGKKFKAVQTGGPSGGVIPEDLLELRVDFDELTTIGSMMGSGGMIVMDEDTCMIDIAKYFLSFLEEESCGKCVPCREGIKQMRHILANISEGKGKEGDMGRLERLAAAVADGSLCALGRTAPNPVLTTIRYFRDEYEAHIKEKRCPAFACKELTSYYIEPSKCLACLICLRQCPTEAVVGARHTIHVIDQEKCTKCGTCYDVCPKRFGAVIRLSGVPVPPPLPEEERVLERAKRAGRAA